MSIFRNCYCVCLLSVHLHMKALYKITAKNMQVYLPNLNNSLYYIKSQAVEEMVDKDGF